MSTIKELLEYTTETLRNAGIETPVVEAGVILCHVLKCNRAYLISHNDRILKAPEFDEVTRLLKGRTEKIPLQYLLGETEFMSLGFKVSPAVLIPRQDTEILVEKCIDIVRELGGQGTRVLDMCTGSGCIAVSIAYYCPEARVTACDVSKEALEIAKINAGQAGVQSRVEFLRGDLFEELNSEEGFEARFDIIASNPPYIETATVEQLQREVRDYEPYIALDGGADGLDFYRRIVEEAPKYLVTGGYLALEIGYNQGESVSKLMEHSFESITLLKDYGGNDRVVVGRLKITG